MYVTIELYICEIPVKSEQSPKSKDATEVNVARKRKNRKRNIKENERPLEDYNRNENLSCDLHVHV